MKDYTLSKRSSDVIRFQVTPNQKQLKVSVKSHKTKWFIVSFVILPLQPTDLLLLGGPSKSVVRKIRAYKTH